MLPISFVSAVVALLPGLLASSLPSATGPRVLVVLDHVDNSTLYHRFFSSLESQGFRLDYRSFNDPELRLAKDGIPSYDHLALFSPRLKTLAEGQLLAPALVHFVEQGGSILHAASTDLTEPQRDFAAQWGVEYDNRGTMVLDHANHNHSSHPSHLLARDLNQNLPFLSHLPTDEPILYEGIGHATVPGLLRTWRALSAPDTAYSWEIDVPVDSSPALSGPMGLVSVAQARNGARVTFAGSLSLFSDAFASSPVQEDGVTAKALPSGNAKFTDALASWTFQASHVLRVVNTSHSPIGPSSSPEDPHTYRVKDNLTYTAQIHLFSHGSWKSYPLPEIQLEVIMLDPYLRLPLTFDTDLDAHSISLTLPDVYGVFTLRALFKRPGWTEIDAKDIIQIRPFHHDEYPRGLSQALPYYAGTISTFLAFLLLSLLWLWSREPLSSPPPPSSEKSPSPPQGKRRATSRK
ncbi:MAG: Dolichyl-diphosphooligosaccharide--protein glycosyltransferase subunit WBP1 [Piptocephalis tieghemiana]|nr:MAG: Dolichyl-diphosphooligosaccharide--protein glycosyltransferase subunit WBP1 [Piptocephalis tieghemiana]